MLVDDTFYPLPFAFSFDTDVHDAMDRAFRAGSRILFLSLGKMESGLCVLHGAQICDRS